MATTQITTHKNYIGGQWVESVTGRTYQVHNPARTDQIVGEFQTSSADDALKAVAAAKEGLAIWANTPAPARANVIYKALEILGRRTDEMAQTITIEEGKPIGDAAGEVKRAMNIMEYAAGEGRRMFG
ncbi:MAG: aldehyde dehydrogenase family protein, partial [SAR202 cluster bacterium]|nr:aldehyde dehydrogenase family protein [SAR202 cluster bacterium]